MSRKYKAYTIPFKDDQQRSLEARIYKDTDAATDPDAIQLLGSEVVMTTEEHDADDPYESVRHQTGTLAVVDNAGTVDWTGLMEKLLSNSKISHPVQLVENPNTVNEAVVWQGFLNCESFDQDYIGTPQALELPLISILEALDSVRYSDSNNGVKTIRQVISAIFDQLMSESGMSDIIKHIYFSVESYEILSKYIDTTILFDTKEYDTLDGTTYLLTGFSCKEILNRICGFMGIVVREEAQDIFFERIRENVGMWYYNYNAFKNNGNKSFEDKDDYAAQMSNFEWKGTGHSRSVKQGAKLVCVRANIEKYSMSMNIPDFIYVDVESRTSITFGSYYAALLGNKRNNVYSNCHFYQYMRNILTIYSDPVGGIFTSRTSEDPTVSDVATMFANSLLVNNTSSVAYLSRSQAISQGSCLTMMPEGAFLCRCKIDTDNTSDVQNGLYCMMLPCSHYANSPIIYEINSVTKALINPGDKIKLTVDYISILDTINIDDNSGTDKPGGHLWFLLKIGNYYYSDNGWTTTESHFSLNINGGKRSMEIPVSSQLFGDVKFALIGEFSYLEINGRAFEFFFKSIDLSYQQQKDYSKSDKGYNSYTTILSTNFSDEVTIETDLATDLNNLKSPSIVNNLSDLTSPMTTMKYYTDENGTYEMRRPELDLLSRMEKFYTKVRRKVVLDLSNYASAGKVPMWFLPIREVTGLETVGKKYLPLAISRNWIRNTARLTCIEIQDENE